MEEFISNNELETKKIAKNLASKLQLGDIVILSGDLGAGKTKFTEGFLSFWRLENEISSPTFTIVNEHSTNDINIYHFDVYRLADIDEFYAIGGTEYFEKGICIIEWGELVKEALPEKYIHVKIDKDELNENLRHIKIEYLGDNKC